MAPARCRHSVGGGVAAAAARKTHVSGVPVIVTTGCRCRVTNFKAWRSLVCRHKTGRKTHVSAACVLCAMQRPTDAYSNEKAVFVICEGMFSFAIKDAVHKPNLKSTRMAKFHDTYVPLQMYLSYYLVFYLTDYQPCCCWLITH